MKKVKAMKKSEFYLGLAKLYAELARITNDKEYLEKAIEYFKMSDEECTPCVENKAKVLEYLIKEKRRLR